MERRAFEAVKIVDPVEQNGDIAFSASTGGAKGIAGIVLRTGKHAQGSQYRMGEHFQAERDAFFVREDALATDVAWGGKDEQTDEASPYDKAIACDNLEPGECYILINENMDATQPYGDFLGVLGL